MSSSPTIAAISTPPGVGGIAVVRLSGPAAFVVARQFVRLPEGVEDAVAPLTRFTTFRLSDGSLLDEGVVTCFPAGHSYTGEPVVEFSCHGSLYVQQRLLQALLEGGARMAEPGEFTRRAFLSGRLNLSQAEAVADLIDSTSQASHALAVSQLRGGYARRLQQLRQQFVDLTALLELELDFSDEEVEFADRSRLLSLVDELSAECHRLVESFSWGNAVKKGVPVAIVGVPNVGKSTLLNALVGEDRAIVSDLPGTTRDTIEDTVTIQGILFRFIDTAGIRQHTADAIEAEGVHRSLQVLQQARIVLHLVDPTAPTSLDLPATDAVLLRVATKSDLVNVSVSVNVDMSISARTGQGLDQLRQRLVDIVSPEAAHLSAQSSVLTNVRHRDALLQVLESLSQVRCSLQQQLPADLVVVDLREALYHLGTITGEVTSPEILATIFSRFCIGK